MTPPAQQVQPGSAPFAAVPAGTPVVIPSPFRAYTGGQREVLVGASTVGGALNELATQYPPLRPHLYSESGELRGFVNVFVNGMNIRDGAGVATTLAGGDSLVIIPSIAGG